MSLGDFTEQAGAYSRSRPGYPPELLDQLVELTQVRSGQPVVDIGAGTGIFTRLLVERGFDVTAIEPNAEMRRRASGSDSVRWVDGTFEETGLPDASQRWAVAAQAFHWADPPRALPELHRVLQRPGWLTVLWNNRDNEQSELLAWTVQALERHVPGFDQSYRSMDVPGILVSTGHFRDVVYHSVAHVVPMSRERYLELWRSNNQLAHAAGAERLAAFLEELARHLAARANEPLAVPYRCDAWTVQAV